MSELFRRAAHLVLRVALMLLSASWMVAGRAATIMVTNLADSGPGTLRQALADNTSLGGGNTITFSNSITGAITLTTTELTVAAPATIRGPGPGVLAVSGNRIGRVFSVLAGTTQISGLTIRDGLVIGGAGALGQDGANGRGGGIFNQSTLTLSNCVVRSNSVVGGMGGQRNLGVVGSGGAGLGGGVCNAGGNVFLISCSFDHNTAVGGQGGGAATGDAGSGGNGLGGAIYTIGGTNQLTACSLLGGVAMGGSGGVSTNGGTAGNRGQGYGAGLYNESKTSVFSSTMSGGNAVGAASGSSVGSGYGGGIFNGTELALSSCTIASNSASGSSFDAGGGIYNIGVLGITNCTIAGNQADFGGGLNGNANAAGTIFGANTAGTGPDVNGTINSFDYNLLQSSSGANVAGASGHVIVGQNPLLGPLQDNGGPTLTMALLPGSPAIDQGNSFGLTTDQRGLPRPLDSPAVANPGGGDGSDIGAYELMTGPQLNIQRASSNSVVLFWSTNTANFNLQSATKLSAGNIWSNVNSARVNVGGQIYVTNSASSTGKFYRLSFP